MRTIRFIAWLAAIMLLISVSAPAMAAERHSGDDRYATAVEISKAGWDSASVVVLARGDVYADALAGVPLAYANNAPVLLTTPKRLPDVTRDELVRLGASKVYILGGIGAVSQGIEDELVGMELEVVRISGENRFDTAAKISQELAPDGVGSVFIASLTLSLRHLMQQITELQSC